MLCAMIVCVSVCVCVCVIIILDGHTYVARMDGDSIYGFAQFGEAIRNDEIEHEQLEQTQLIDPYAGMLHNPLAITITIAITIE